MTDSVTTVHPFLPLPKEVYTFPFQWSYTWSRLTWANKMWAEMSWKRWEEALKLVCASPSPESQNGHQEAALQPITNIN